MMTFWDALTLIITIAVAMWIVRGGILWIMQLLRDSYEVISGKRRWDE